MKEFSFILTQKTSDFCQLIAKGYSPAIGEEFAKNHESRSQISQEVFSQKVRSNMWKKLKNF